eukprot:scaffold3737_cov19-Tisochrysis_lutea.AAC.1
MPIALRDPSARCSHPPTHFKTCPQLTVAHQLNAAVVVAPQALSEIVEEGQHHLDNLHAAEQG